MKLSEQTCKPIKDLQPLEKNKVEDYLNQLNDWSLEDDRIKKNFEFNDFQETMEFVNKVAEIAETEEHHPDIYISYNRVRLTLSTHDIDALSINDFIVAAKIDDIQ
ncbi:MAG: 4a-hydroxytetrahydrobiopterin dehydratase [Candidatus Nealsonbacteria bacterium]|nr:4a-hydroxytetrahydrobiopterin dehydratase [Candidatus Nealsonbacteria bacterium]